MIERPPRALSRARRNGRKARRLLNFRPACFFSIFEEFKAGPSFDLKGLERSTPVQIIMPISHQLPRRERKVTFEAWLHLETIIEPDQSAVAQEGQRFGFGIVPERRFRTEQSKAGRDRRAQQPPAELRRDHGHRAQEAQRGSRVSLRDGSSQGDSDIDGDCTRTLPSPPQEPAFDKGDSDPPVTLVQPPAPLPRWWPSWLGRGAPGTQGASNRFPLEVLQACGASVASTPALLEGKVIQNRERGDCLFLVLAHDLRDALKHGALRTMLMTFLLYGLIVTSKWGCIHSPLLQLQFMKAVAEYATYMGARSKWGGLVIEILLFSRRFRRQVQVHVKHGDSLALIYSAGSRTPRPHALSTMGCTTRPLCQQRNLWAGKN